MDRGPKGKMGRNEPCYCGSGKKYKRCHGSPVHLDEISKTIPKLMRRHEADELQRKRQQGLGNPIISAEIAGQRIVAVKNRLLHSPGWKTFQDFLNDYVRMAFGTDWGNAELKKPLEQRHPLLQWYQQVCDFQRINYAGSGQVSTALANGAMMAYLRLAYDLYALDHNAELQGQLLARLRNNDKFWGARYEVYVAAVFVRAGFTIEFEDESDRSRSHCEFTATHKGTGRSFSVEAKRREGTRLRIVRLFNDALSKHANHPRVIFIDINLPSAGPNEFPPYLVKAQARLRRLELEPLREQQRPPAYVFVTNTPWEHHLDGPSPPSAAIIEGFQIPDFKGGVNAPSLRAAIEAREKHIEMHELMKSLEQHSIIPSTFDGDLPEYAFGKGMTRIRIGDRYMVPDGKGSQQPGEVTMAIVVESQRHALCGVQFDNGTSALCTMPLSDDELSAWRQHPETFFGEVGQSPKPLTGALATYDFFHESCKPTSKERLLEAMKESADFRYLSTLTQAELASIRAERLTYGVLAMSKPNT
jgi:hypothetical protein